MGSCNLSPLIVCNLENSLKNLRTIKYNLEKKNSKKTTTIVRNGSNSLFSSGKTINIFK